MAKARLTIAAAILAVAVSAVAAAAENNFWTQSLYFENDLFSGTDRNYTNGVKFTLISPNLSPYVEAGKIPRKLLEKIHQIPFVRESGLEYTHKVEFSVGQSMYTPADIAATELITDDRPYSGWLYFATAYHRKNIVNNVADFMDTVEIQLGMVGPASFAEETQKFVHRVFDRTTPNGWDNQLDNEPGLIAIFERKWLLHRGRAAFGHDTIAHLGGAVGNVSTYLNGGIEVRLGWNIPKNYGVSLIRPAGSTRLTVDDNFSVYLFGAIDSRAVLRDIFLDGNTFTDSHSVDKKHFTADLAGGLTVSFKKMMLSWTYIKRTKEFGGQQKSHGFGALSITFQTPFF